MCQKSSNWCLMVFLILLLPIFLTRQKPLFFSLWRHISGNSLPTSPKKPRNQSQMWLRSFYEKGVSQGVSTLCEIFLLLDWPEWLKDSGGMQASLYLVSVPSWSPNSTYLHFGCLLSRKYKRHSRACTTIVNEAGLPTSRQYKGSTFGDYDYYDD